MITNNDKYDEVGGIIAFENGELDLDEVIELFTHLRDSGTLWHLQGFYQRTYHSLCKEGHM